MRFVLALLLLPVLARAETVRLPGPDGLILNAELYAPPGKPSGPAIVALHGCGGPFPRRDVDWGRRLAAMGHVVLMPDSFGSRGLGSQCSNAARAVRAGGLRRQDALAALKWLAARPGTPPGGLVLMGWSDGGSTVLATGHVAPDLPPGLIRGLIAFYPACRAAAARANYRPAAPLLILIGEADDWTPAAPCHALAAKLPGVATLVTYPDAYHEFDIADWPVKLRNSAQGRVHVGGNAAARADALRQVPAFIAALP
jgi:dienelactone hydrolase